MDESGAVSRRAVLLGAAGAGLVGSMGGGYAGVEAGVLPGRFDDAADFESHNVFTHTEWVEHVAVRIDCGTDDGFYPAARDYASKLSPRPVTNFATGGHTPGYWRRNAAAQLTFLADALR